MTSGFFYLKCSGKPRIHCWATLETTQGQMDGFFRRLIFKCFLPEVASVEDRLNICPWVAFTVGFQPEFQPDIREKRTPLAIEWVGVMIYNNDSNANTTTTTNSGRGTMRAEDAQGTPTQRRKSPSIPVYEVFKNNNLFEAVDVVRISRRRKHHWPSSGWE